MSEHRKTSGLVGLIAAAMAVCCGLPLLAGVGVALGATGLAVGSGIAVAVGAVLAVGGWRQRNSRKEQPNASLCREDPGQPLE